MVDKERLWDRLDDIEDSVDGVDKNLATAMCSLTIAVTKLTDRIEHIGEKVIPIKLVALMFLIVFVSIAGVEGAKHLFKVVAALAAP